MKVFLKAKHWHLFLLAFGIPMIFYMIMMYSVISRVAITIDGNKNPDAVMLDAVTTYMQFVPFIVILFMGVLYGWYWSVAMGLQSKKPESVRMNISLFKIFFFFPVIYILLITMSMSFFIQSVLNNQVAENAINFGPFFVIIVPIHLFSMFCIFYCMYFVAKTIKTVELQRETNFSDFVGEFFLIWFYPIGIWILQPKINQLAEGRFGNTPGAGTSGSTILDERMMN